MKSIVGKVALVLKDGLSLMARSKTTPSKYSGGKRRLSDCGDPNARGFCDSQRERATCTFGLFFISHPLETRGLPHALFHFSLHRLPMMVTIKDVRRQVWLRETTKDEMLEELNYTFPIPTSATREALTAVELSTSNEH